MERMNDEEWLAVYTRPRCEKQVLRRLQAIGVEVYCPMAKVLRKWSDRKKMLQVPLIPSYVFVKVSESGRYKILQIPAVINFLFWLGKPAIVKEKEIVTLKKFTNNYSDISVGSIKYTIGDKVRIEDGAFRGLRGEVLRENNTKVVLQLEQLGLQITAVIPANKLHIEDTSVNTCS